MISFPFPFFSSVDAFVEQVLGDLVAYAAHANRTTVEKADIELLLQRQRQLFHGSRSQTLAFLIRKYLPADYVEELLPVSRAHNKVTLKHPNYKFKPFYTNERVRDQRKPDEEITWVDSGSGSDENT